MLRKRKLVKDLIPPPSIYIHMCTLYTYTNIYAYMPRFGPSGFLGPSRCLIPTPGLTIEYPICAVSVCVCVRIHAHTPTYTPTLIKIEKTRTTPLSLLLSKTGLIQFVYGSHLRLAADLSFHKVLFPPCFSRAFGTTFGNNTTSSSRKITQETIKCQQGRSRQENLFVETVLSSEHKTQTIISSVHDETFSIINGHRAFDVSIFFPVIERTEGSPLLTACLWSNPVGARRRRAKAFRRRAPPLRAR